MGIVHHGDDDDERDRPSETVAPSSIGGDDPPLLPVSISGDEAGVSNGVSSLLLYIGLQMYMSSSAADESGEEAASRLLLFGTDDAGKRKLLGARMTPWAYKAQREEGEPWRRGSAEAAGEVLLRLRSKRVQ